MSNYSEAQGGTGATTYQATDDGEGSTYDAASDDATAGQNGFVIIQTLEPILKTVQDVGIFARG